MTPETDDRADDVLLARLLAGDEAAFSALVSSHHGLLLRLALTFVSNHAAAEEVVQETWLGVLKGLKSFEGRASLKTWMFRILVNRARTRGARDGRTVNFSALEDPDGDAEALTDRFRRRDDGFSPHHCGRNRIRRTSSSAPKRYSVSNARLPASPRTSGPS